MAEIARRYRVTPRFVPKADLERMLEESSHRLSECDLKAHLTQDETRQRDLEREVYAEVCDNQVSLLSLLDMYDARREMAGPDPEPDGKNNQNTVSAFQAPGGAKGAQTRAFGTPRSLAPQFSPSQVAWGRMGTGAMVGAGIGAVGRLLQLPASIRIPALGSWFGRASLS